jgi:hypothetical protein
MHLPRRQVSVGDYEPRRGMVQMPLSELEKAELFSGLKIRGWTWREAFIYAPHGTMWLLGSEPWVGDLSEFYERMLGRLERNNQVGWMHEDMADHRDLVADTKSLVETLAEMLSAPRDSSATA